MKTWRNRSPGNLDVELSEVSETEAGPLLEDAANSAAEWRRSPLEERCRLLKLVQTGLEARRAELARGIAIEVGKSLREADAEVGAVIAKIDLTIADAKRYLAEEQVADGPFPGLVRRRARGPALVIAPFNFPLHLGHGAAVAHLLAGNPVVFKPSPLAAGVAGTYGEIMAEYLPPGVFQIAQGGAETAQMLAMHPVVRAICFTGSLAAGRALARALADEIDKELALELGGKNPAIILEDADMEAAANGVADGICLTCGQRCNSTSRVYVQRSVEEEFSKYLAAAMAKYQPGDPVHPETLLGPLISETALNRYAAAIAQAGDWRMRGAVLNEVNGLHGYYVKPAILALPPEEPDPFPDELFCPVATWRTFDSEEEALRLANESRYGLSVSLFTRSKERFDRMAAELNYGNIYANLATTFSPSTLPFGGLGLSGNGRPGGRGFIRFATVEQALQSNGFLL